MNFNNWFVFSQQDKLSIDSTRDFFRDRKKRNVLTAYQQQQHMQQQILLYAGVVRLSTLIMFTGWGLAKFSMLLIYISRDIYRARNWHLL